MGYSGNLDMVVLQFKTHRKKKRGSTVSMITDLDNDFMPLDYIFSNYSILVSDSENLELPGDEVFKNVLNKESKLDWFGEPEFQYKAVALEEECDAPSGFKWIPIRSLFLKENSSNEKIQRASRAHSILKWRKKQKYCCCCGKPLKDVAEETARSCDDCGFKIYPSVTPVVVVLIEKDDEILLARHVERNNDVYSCLAGFIGVGESAEEAVVREIREQTGIEVENIRYVTSQGWPFPDEMMLAFKATYKSGNIELIGDELEEAHWFKKDKLPEIPKEGSVVWSLITGAI